MILTPPEYITEPDVQVQFIGLGHTHEGVGWYIYHRLPNVIYLKVSPPAFGWADHYFGETFWLQNAYPVGVGVYLRIELNRQEFRALMRTLLELPRAAFIYMKDVERLIP